MKYQVGDIIYSKTTARLYTVIQATQVTENHIIYEMSYYCSKFNETVKRLCVEDIFVNEEHVHYPVKS